MPIQSNHEAFNKVVADTFDELRRLLHVKGGEYAGDFDRFANFKRNATKLGVHPFTIWACYHGKHQDAIDQYVRDMIHDTPRERGEAITGRIDDAINYLLLLKGMIVLEVEALNPKSSIRPEDFLTTMQRDALTHK